VVRRAAWSALLLLATPEEESTLADHEGHASNPLPTRLAILAWTACMPASVMGAWALRPQVVQDAGSSSDALLPALALTLLGIVVGWVVSGLVTLIVLLKSVAGAIRLKELIPATAAWGFVILACTLAGTIFFYGLYHGLLVLVWIVAFPMLFSMWFMGVSDLVFVFPVMGLSLLLLLPSTLARSAALGILTTTRVMRPSLPGIEREAGSIAKRWAFAFGRSGFVGALIILVSLLKAIGGEGGIVPWAGVLIGIGMIGMLGAKVGVPALFEEAARASRVASG